MIKPDIKSKLSSTAQSISASGIRKFFDVASKMPNCISLGVGEPDFVTPWRVTESGVYSLEQGHTHYTSNFGLLELRQQITAYYEENYNVSYNPENQIIVTMGVSEALDITLRALINIGDEILVPEPAYVSYFPNILLLHGVPVPIQTKKENNFKLMAEEVRAKITPKTKAILLNSPNNPTGAVIDKVELEKIAKIAHEHQLFVISDEIYSELTYDQDPMSIAEFSWMSDYAIVLNGFSKAYAMTGWRIGYICAHPDVIEIVMKIHQYTALCAPIMGQVAAVEALKNGRKEKLRMKEEYRRRRNLITDGFNNLGLYTYLPGGAFYVFPDISTSGLTPETFAERLLYEKEVAVVPGNVFGMAKYDSIRCSYATSFEKIEVALERIKAFMDQL